MRLGSADVNTITPNRSLAGRKLTRELYLTSEIRSSTEY